MKTFERYLRLREQLILLNKTAKEVSQTLIYYFLYIISYLLFFVYSSLLISLNQYINL